jgi:arginyl-tRNA synthetase
MHIGHARGAVVGDVLASLMIKAGYEVTKEYYINDAGAQVDTLARSAYLRYREALGESIGEIPEGLYPGDYLKPVGESLAQTAGKKFLGMPEQEWLPIVRAFAVESMLALIRNDLMELGIEHETFTSERGLVEAGKVKEALAFFEKKGLVYRGVLEPPKGKTPEDWEPREQTLFKATQFGDDVDRPLKKSDDSWTYFAGDIAYHLDKYKRGFKQMVLVLGADHGGYVKRMKAAVKAMSDGEADVHVQLYQLVKFMEGGEPLKMSKRKGTFLTVRDVIEAVGKDVVRFIMLTRKASEVLEFDIKKVTEQSKDNPVFYVQYAHARAWSVLRNAAKDAPEAASHLDQVDAKTLARLTAPEELTLIRTLAQWPRVVESAAAGMEPHRVAFFLQEVAAAFHQLWNRGKDDPSLRFILPEDTELTKARLALVRASSITIHTGLSVLGVEPVREM